MHRFTIVGGLLALFAALSVCAQNANTTINLGAPITVTATRTPLIADQEVAPVTVVTAAEIQLSGAQTIGSLLQQFAGFDLASNGGPGQPTSLFLRGTNSNQILLMINGVRINAADGHGAPLANIHLNDIERIEIVKGPRAALYGTDAIGGVINIITRQASEGMHYGAQVGGGRYGTYENGGHFDYGQGRSAFGISASSYHTDGFPAVAGTDFDSGNTNRSWNGYGRTTLGGLDLDLKHWQSQGNTQYTQFASAPPYTLAPTDENYANRITSLGLTGHFLSGWRSHLNLSHLLDTVDQAQPDPFNVAQAPDFTRTQRNVVDWQNDIAVGRYQLFTAGLYAEAQHAAALSFGSGYDQTDHINALYAEDDIHAGKHRLVLAARDTHDQAFGNHVTWNADYGYDFTGNTRLTAGAGAGFRAPSATERFGFGGNPDLQPEASQNLEVGLRQKISLNQNLTLSVYRNNLDNLIQFAVTPTNLNGQNQNIARAQVRGVEAAYHVTTDHWSWRTDLTIQKPENLSTGTRLLRRAERTLTTAFAWHNDTTSLGLRLLLTGQRDDLDFNTAAAVSDAGYVLAGITVRQALGHGLSLRASLDNLLDTHYQTANGYNTAGRSLFIRLEYQSR